MPLSSTGTPKVLQKYFRLTATRLHNIGYFFFWSTSIRLSYGTPLLRTISFNMIARHIPVLQIRRDPYNFDGSRSETSIADLTPDPTHYCAQIWTFNYLIELLTHNLIMYENTTTAPRPVLYQKIYINLGF